MRGREGRDERVELGAIPVRQFGALVLLAGTGAVAGLGVAAGGQWRWLALAVLAISLAAFALLTFRLAVAQAAGTLAASKVSDRRPRRGCRARAERERQFNPASAEDEGREQERAKNR